MQGKTAKETTLIGEGILREKGERMKDFSDKTAIIAGAGSGLGPSLALQLHAAGERLKLCDTDLAGIEETLRLTGECGKRVSITRVDVADLGEDVTVRRGSVRSSLCGRYIDQQCWLQSV